MSPCVAEAERLDRLGGGDAVSTGGVYVWTQLTWPQVAAILALVRATGQHPGMLERLLPDPRQRTALRSATDTLDRLTAAHRAAQ